MRTTVRINDHLLERAKARAVAEGRTLTSLIEEGLTILLSSPKGERPRIKLPLSQATGGVLPGVDLNRACDLEEIMSAP